jgi:hypothetical protein
MENLEEMLEQLKDGKMVQLKFRVMEKPSDGMMEQLKDRSSLKNQ